MRLKHVKDGRFGKRKRLFGCPSRQLRKAFAGISRARAEKESRLLEGGLPSKVQKLLIVHMDTWWY